MKKRLLKIPMPLVLAITFIFLSSTNASAENISTEIPSSITYYDDGSYDIETCYTEISKPNLLLSTTSTYETKSYSKKLVFRSTFLQISLTYFAFFEIAVIPSPNSTYSPL